MILVTGGSGFLGTHIVKALAEAGKDVINFSLVEPSRLATRELGRLVSRVRFVEGDILEPGQLAEILDSREVECIVHGAAVNGEVAAREDPERAVATNVMGTAHVLANAVRGNVRRVVYLGSGSQYGNRRDPTPLAEDEPTNPSGIYATTKQSAELLGHAYAAITGLNFISLRISAPYGPHEEIEPSPMHIRFWCQAALEGRRVDLPDGGDHPRDFTFAADTARGVLAACLCQTPSFEIYNISSGRPITVREVIAVLNEIKPGSALSAGPGFLGGDDPRFVTSLRGPLDIGRAERDLGFSAETDLAAGIRHYLSWLEENES